MVDYSRFDKIDDDINDDEDVKESPLTITEPSSRGLPTQQSEKMTKKGKSNRYRFEYEGRLIYEWEQSLEEPPPGAKKSDFDIVITHSHLKIGIKKCPPFIDEDMGGPVKVDECYWMLSDGELNINLQKMTLGQTWESALCGRDGQKIDNFTKEEARKQMMLERFQYEHPGFDFSGADFNGMVPDATDFMGGIRHR